MGYVIVSFFPESAVSLMARISLRKTGLRMALPARAKTRVQFPDRRRILFSSPFLFFWLRTSSMLLKEV